MKNVSDMVVPLHHHETSATFIFVQFFCVCDERRNKKCQTRRAKKDRWRLQGPTREREMKRSMSPTRRQNSLSMLREH